MADPVDGEVLDAWTSWLRAARLSPGSVKLRVQCLGRLSSWLPGGLLEASDADLVNWLAGERRAAETHRSMRASLRAFYGWAVDQGLVERSVAERLPTVRAPLTVPKPVPEDVLETVLAAADQETALMLVLGAYAGLRRAEIAAVHRRDVTASGLRVTGKGERVRVVPVHPVLADHLERWPAQEWLFPGRWGGHASIDYVKVRVGAALPEGYTCHKLRHRFATRAYAGSRDLFAVQQLLGHSKPETTSRYVLVPTDALQSAVMSIG